MKNFNFPYLCSDFVFVVVVVVVVDETLFFFIKNVTFSRLKLFMA